MLTEDRVQRGMQQVGRRVIAHDVVAPRHVDFGDRLIAHLRLTGDHLADMHDDTGGRPTHICDLDLPSGLAAVRGSQRANESFVGDLSTGFDVEAGTRQDDLDRIAKRGRGRPTGR